MTAPRIDQAARTARILFLVNRLMGRTATAGEIAELDRMRAESQA